jgi:hypothetical protein
VEEGAINIARLAEWRVQMFAEALHWLEHGSDEEKRYYTTSGEEKELVIPEQEKFRMTDVWTDILADYVNKATSDKGTPSSLPVNSRRTHFTTWELFDKALQIKADRIDGAKNMETRLGNCMRELGFIRYRESTGVTRHRGYCRELPAQPIAGPADPAPAASPPPPTSSGDDDVPKRATEQPHEEALPDDIPF